MPELEVFIPFVRLREFGIPWSRVHLRRLVRRGAFPAPVEISANRRGWRKSDLLAWQEKRPERGRAAAP